MIRPFELVQRLKSYMTDVNDDIINRAYVFAMKAHGSQLRASGDLYFSHPLEVAGILTTLRLDTASIITGLLHDTVEDTDVTLEDIAKAFGKEVAELVDGVTKLTRLELQSEETKQAENFRKLVLAMSSDIRVLIVKLADRLHNMRTLHHVKSAQKRQRIARETMDIYAPLAERIGMHSIKDELEDLSFSLLYPESRESVVSRLRHLHATHESHIENILLELRALISQHKIEASITGREKTPFSIWRKMHSKSMTFEQLSDIIAFRIIPETVAECYQILGILHGEYSLIPGRFKDYISMPKRNGYQSLHTALIGPMNQRIEVQIRTSHMQDIAEYGIAAHWQYKQQVTASNPKDDPKYAWLRGILEILEHTHNPKEFLEHTKLEMFSDQVFCFTPQGDVISLPKGATTIDFAYAVHSHVGDHTVAARINGRQMPLRTVLENGDQVEIVTSKTQHPSPTWERFVVTGKARSHVRRFIRQKQRNQFWELGKSLLNKAFAKENIEYNEHHLKRAVKHLDALDVDDLILKVGHGHRSARDVAHFIADMLQKDNNKETQDALSDACEASSPSKTFSKKAKAYEPSMSIKGLIPGMALHFAGCCHPVPGDRIVGLIMTGKGVNIHTRDCDNITHFHEPERLLDLAWQDEISDSPLFTSRVFITFRNASGSLASLSSAIAKQGGNITNFKIVHRSQDFWDVLVDIEVHHTDHLNSIIVSLRTLGVVSHAERSK